MGTINGNFKDIFGSFIGVSCSYNEHRVATNANIKPGLEMEHADNSQPKKNSIMIVL